MLKSADSLFIISDFFALMATEKRFIQLEKGFWDLRENHTAEISIKEIEDELEDELELDLLNRLDFLFFK